MQNIFDAETTGIPLWTEPSEHADQPHIVEIASRLYLPTGELAESFSAIVRPDGWIIPADMIAIHGITQEQAMDEGISEAEALEGFLAINARASLRVAHNINFDDRIIRIAIARYHGKDAADAYKESNEKYCTCNASRTPVGLKKPPTLEEAYKHFTGEDLQDAHRAMPDAKACAKIYFALQGVTLAEIA